MNNSLRWILTWNISIAFAFLFCAALNAEEAAKWDIENPPGPISEQKILVQQGTWISVDVSPDGRTIVFDLLGDLYSMPIGGADGSNGVSPTKLTSGMCWDMQPRFSPDGDWICFTSDRVGKSNRAGDNIWIMRKDGTDLRQVTNETFRLVNNPSWSPDGNYLVARKHFTGRRSLGAGEIWMYHRAAAESNAMEGVPLTKRPTEQKDVNEPIFSRDGKYLFYSQDVTSGDLFEYDKDSNQQIYAVRRLNLRTGETDSYITGPGGACRPTPSPDGKQIAFVRRVGSRTGLHILDMESGKVRLVYDLLERDMQEAWAIHGVYPAFAWTPDGNEIIAWAKGQIRRIRIDDGTASVIPFHIHDTRKISQAVRFPIEVAPVQFPVKMLRWVQVSPTGKQVVFQALGHLYVRDLPDGAPRRLTQQQDHFEFYPSYSPDGKYIVYSTWNDETLGSIRVVTADVADQESWKVTSKPGHYSEPVFAPDSQSIVYVKGTGGMLTSPLWSREPGLYRVDVRGGDPVRISEQGSSPQFGSESGRVFYINGNGTKDADNLGFYSVDLDGRHVQHHLRSAWATDYRISPDGKWVAFIERFNVYIVPLVHSGQTIDVGPKTTSIPTAKVSQEAGDGIHFSGDSKQLHWSLGPTLYSLPLQEAFSFLKDPVAAGAEAAEAKKLRSIEIGMTSPYAKPSSKFALVGGKIITMGAAGTIEDGTILVEGNRITAVGPRTEVAIPSDVQTIATPGLVIMPGLIDVHAHGSQAVNGMTPQANWINYAQLALGVTTIHDPSNDSHSVFAASELAKSGGIIAPRIFSTGTILYGAAGSFKAEIDSLEDAKFHLRRMKSIGAFSVKSYNQPRRDQRQQVIAAARELGMMVVPEGGSTFMHNMTMIVDGHTGIEHTLPVQTAYADVMDLWRNTQVGYTPTLCVAYGGISGERYWYEVDDLWLHPRLNQFVPPFILHPRSRRRQKAPLEDYNHIQVAQIAKQVVRDGGLVQAGGHGQMAGMSTHWELWSFVQGGMTPMESLKCGTLNGAKYLGLDQDLGSLEVGKLADILVIERGFDPSKEIRHSERIEMVVANGRLFDGKTMAEIGGQNAPAPKFYFRDGSQGMGSTPPKLPGCECCRPGGAIYWMYQGE